MSASFTRAYIDTAVLDRLSVVLSSAKLRGGLVDSKVTWLEGTKYDAPAEESIFILETHRFSLRQLKDAKNALMSLLRTADEAIAIHQVTCEPLMFRQGLDSLPDEVLGRIFELSCTTEDETIQRNVPVILSHVNRRFRAVAFATPIIWGCLDSLQPLDQLEEMIDRSGFSELTMVVSSPPEIFGKRRAAMRQMLDVVADDVERCSDIRFVDVLTGRELGIVDRFFDKHEYPSLKSLTIEKSWVDDTDYSEYIDEMDFGGDWNMPNLRHFRGVNVQASAAMGIHLTTCELEFVFEKPLEWDFTPIFKAFQSTKGLESLSFKFKNIIGSDDRQSDAPPRAWFPNLRSFSLHVCEGIDILSLQTVFWSLNMPALTTTSINIGTAQPYAHELLEQFLQQPRERPALKSLRLVIHNSLNPFTSDIMSVLMRRAASLQDVHLQVSGLTLPLPTQSHSLKWKTVYFDRCDSLDDRAAKHLTDALENDCEVRMNYCRNISKRFLQHLLARFGDKFHYES
ncbi:hypothetical protein BD410DRAFT_482724 [Rickenella mellea]|uniref:F-box domain-containing protein n=1 Tax=Rickenella mellea TaxID=50990 RepID=A0A4Y7QIH1_9AGAM|nr:hypothetical protein BD410DRAFT_482724 [Rickenella mellea]